MICFDEDLLGVDGRQLDPICRDPADPRSVRDELLRWRFRQAVLANMRGAGEPVFEMDFFGGDMMGEIMNGPEAAERMEFELFSRLVGHSQLEHATPLEAWKECKISDTGSADMSGRVHFLLLEGRRERVAAECVCTAMQ